MTKKVTIVDMQDCDMLAIAVDKQEAFYGNYWDFNWHDSLVSILEKAGVEVEVLHMNYDEYEE